MQMRETARASVFGSQRTTAYSRDGTSDESHAPMLQNAAAHAASKGSGLRYYVSEDGAQMEGDRSEEDLMMRRRPDPGRF